MKLQEESAQHELSLAEAQSCISHLTSVAHRLEIVEDYRHNVFGKAEVAMACMAGYDNLVAQFLVEMRSVPDHFHYPSRVATYMEALRKILKQGGGLDHGRSVVKNEGSDDEADVGFVEKTGGESEGSVREASKGSAKDSWVSSSGKKKREGAKPEVQSTPSLPTANVSLPLTPGVGIDIP